MPEHQAARPPEGGPDGGPSGGRERRPGGRTPVVLGPFAFIKGWLIAVVLWVAGLCIVQVTQEIISSRQADGGANFVPGMIMMLVVYGFGTALLVATPLAALLAFLLRPVQNQWLHVAAFFAVPTLTYWVLGGLLGLGWTLAALGFWATVGASAAVGRLAVWRNVTAWQDDALQPGGS
ncbi:MULTISPECIES: hypothetical protein [unclassified Arthrobacter]|uniref:hypothetical protein n=1 Tax=unclassified Arthrobacter TaxID=235627 RepID=UPI0012F851E1|nr:hypothetical protein [Arthrobacter sp. Leaf141]